MTLCVCARDPSEPKPTLHKPVRTVWSLCRQQKRCSAFFVWRRGRLSANTLDCPHRCMQPSFWVRRVPGTYTQSHGAPHQVTLAAPVESSHGEVKKKPSLGVAHQRRRYRLQIDCRNEDNILLGLKQFAPSPPRHFPVPHSGLRLFLSGAVREIFLVKYEYSLSSSVHACHFV